MEDGLSDILRQMEDISRSSERELDLTRQLTDANEKLAVSESKSGGGEGGGGVSPGSLIPQKTTDIGSNETIKAAAETAESSAPFGGLVGTLSVITGITKNAQIVLHAMQQHENDARNLAASQLKISEEGFALAKAAQFDGSDNTTDQLLQRRALINAPVDTGNALASYLNGDRRTQAQIESRTLTADAIQHERQRKVGMLASENTLLNANDMRNAINAPEVLRRQDLYGRITESDGSFKGVASAALGFAWDQTAGRLTGSLTEKLEKDALDLARRRLQAIRESGDRYEADLVRQPWYKTEQRNRLLFIAAAEKERMMKRNDWNRD